MICGCDCERQDHGTYEMNSPKCSNNGTYKCGICDCNAGNFGKKCECNTSANNHFKNTQSCRRDNTSLVDCSGRGECICGICDCFPPPDEQSVSKIKHFKSKLNYNFYSHHFIIYTE